MCKPLTSSVVIHSKSVNHPCSRDTPLRGPCSVILADFERSGTFVRERSVSAGISPRRIPCWDSIISIYIVVWSSGTTPELRNVSGKCLGECTADHQLLPQARNSCVCRYLSRSIFEPSGYTVAQPSELSRESRSHEG